MKILHNNFRPAQLSSPIVAKCEICGSKLELESTDINSEGKFLCPCCGETSGVIPNDQNVCYPRDFCKVEGNNCIPVSDEETEEWVRKCASELDVGIDYNYIFGGDTFVFAVKDGEGSAYVVVAKNYEDALIDIPEDRF